MKAAYLSWIPPFQVRRPMLAAIAMSTTISSIARIVRRPVGRELSTAWRRYLSRLHRRKVRQLRKPIWQGSNSAPQIVTPRDHCSCRNRERAMSGISDVGSLQCCGDTAFQDFDSTVERSDRRSDLGSLALAEFDFPLPSGLFSGVMFGQTVAYAGWLLPGEIVSKQYL